MVRLLLSSFTTRSTVLHPQVNYSFGYIDTTPAVGGPSYQLELSAHRFETNSLTTPLYFSYRLERVSTVIRMLLLSFCMFWVSASRIATTCASTHISTVSSSTSMTTVSIVTRPLPVPMSTSMVFSRWASSGDGPTVP